MISAFQPWVEQVRGEDGECSEVERGVEVLVFFEKKCGGEDAVDGLEVEREVHAVGGERAEEMDVIGVGEDGADPGEEEDPKPVEAGGGKQSGKATGIEKREGCQADRARPEHFPADHGQRVAAFGDDGAVEDGENGCEERAEQCYAETKQVSALDPGDEKDARYDDEAEQDFERPDAAAGEKWLGECGE